MNIKKGDNVILIAGKDKGKTGKVLFAIPDTNRVIVDGVNMRKHNVKPRRAGEKGHIASKEASMHISNVQLLDPKGGKRTRIGSKIVNGKKVRIAKKSGQEI